MTTTIKHKTQFAPREPLAIEPRAFGQEYEPCLIEAGKVVDTVAVVSISGPLMHHASYWHDSYDGIRARVSDALAHNPRTVLLAIDSPGGLVAGMVDTSRALRAMCAESGVRLIAHVEGMCTSAAYALASSAEWIGASQTATIGSIGILDGLVDVTESNAAHGVKIQLISSGQRKTDGNPDGPMTDGAIKATQDHVNELAEMFFSLVAEHGYSSADELRALQAGIFTGVEATRIGLISGVATFEQAIAIGMQPAALSSNEATDKGTENMASPMDDAVESLRKAAAGDDEEMAKNARKALKALGEEDEETAEEEEEETSAEEEEEETSAEEEEEETSAEEEEEETSAEASKSGKGAVASAHEMAIAAVAEIHNFRAEQKRERMAKRRAELIGSRDDLAPEMVALMEDKKTSLATVKRLVKTLKRGKPAKRTAASMAADTRVSVTRGAGNQSADDHTTSRQTPEEASALRAQMGMGDTVKAVKHTAHRVTFGATVPKKGN